MRRPSLARSCVLGFLMLACALFAVPSAGGQTATPETATPETATPETATPPAATAAPTEAPAPTPDPATPVPTTTPGTPAPTTTPLPSPSPSPTPVLEVPVLERTPPRDTTLLVETLLPMMEWGLSFHDVLVEGMGRFPVAGYSRYSDDWLAARYVPTPHLHRGLDIFAAMGTPVRAPDAGVVTKVSDSYPGGKSVTMRVYDGTTYYFGHLASRAWGLEVGQSLEVGTLLGYVGNTGNAQGGVPHLHLEVEKEGITVPPKPIVDEWLAEAEASAGDWMERKRIEIDVARRLPVCIQEPSMGPNVTLFQILNDPFELDLSAATCESQLVDQAEASLVDLLVAAPA